MNQNHEISLIFRLRIGYFLQFAIWGAWGLALPGFLVHWFSGREVGYIYMLTSLGTVTAPFLIGPLVDKYFSAQKVLGFLHFLSAVLIFLMGLYCLAGIKKGAIDFKPLFVLAVLEGLCFMPSVALMNTIVFRHLTDFSKAPGIFIFGTLGWIVSNLFVETFLGGAAVPYFLLFAAGLGFLMSIYSITLPKTLPVRSAITKSNNKFEVFRLFKKRDFSIFMICAFMVLIFSGGFYYPSLVLYLSENGFPAPLALSTINQFSELVFMSILGFCVLKFGLKKVLLLGMSAWTLRYFLFAHNGFLFALFGLALHGIAFAFLYSASYMYGDRIAPKHLKASVQSLIAFVLLGIGPFIGSILFGIQLDRFPPQLTRLPHSEITSLKNTPPKKSDPSEIFAEKPLPRWDDPDMEKSPLRWLNLSQSVKYLLGQKDIFRQKTNLGFYQNASRQITAEELPDQFEIDGIVYTKSELIETFKMIISIQKKNPSSVKEISMSGKHVVSRSDYLKVRCHDWHRFYIQPAIWLLFWSGIFALFGKKPENPAC